MAALGEVPFGLYYGSVDCDAAVRPARGPLRRAHRRPRDHRRRCGPRSRPALAWIDGPGDPDGDGFVEYLRATEQGLANQGWKDSHDAIFHADGTLAEGPIALAEVQGYVYAAKRIAGALRARARPQDREARKLEAEADRLAEHFEAAFWCHDLGTYALALDGDKQPCRVRTSNAGQVLFTGIARPERAPHGRRRAAAAALLLRLGHPHGGARRGALQSDVLSQRLDLAARQRPDRARASRATASSSRSSALFDGLFDAATYMDLPAAAGAVLRLPAPARPRADALSRRLLAAGLGERHAVRAA